MESLLTRTIDAGCDCCIVPMRFPLARFAVTGFIPLSAESSKNPLPNYVHHGSIP